MQLIFFLISKAQISSIMTAFIKLDTENWKTFFNYHNVNNTESFQLQTFSFFSRIINNCEKATLKKVKVFFARKLVIND